MSSPRRFPLSVLIYEMRLLIIGREAWLERARNGDIKRTDTEIARKTQGLERMRAIANILIGMQRQQQGIECHGQNKNNKA